MRTSVHAFSTVYCGGARLHKDVLSCSQHFQTRSNARPQFYVELRGFVDRERSKGTTERVTNASHRRAANKYQINGTATRTKPRHFNYWYLATAPARRGGSPVLPRVFYTHVLSRDFPAAK